MTTLEQIRAKRSEILAIAERNGVENLRIFGSVARGDDRPDSDIDFLGDVKRGHKLLGLYGCQVELEEYFGRKVDLLFPQSLHWSLKDSILSEATPL